MVATLPEYFRLWHIFPTDLGQVVMIGDHHADLRAAIAAGFAFCFCNYGYGHADGLFVAAKIGKPLELLTYFS